MITLCPCHSKQPYKKCCAPYHQGKAAPTPVDLMRSRYAAYALGLIGYIIATAVPSNQPPKTERLALKQFCQTSQFVGLEIKGSTQLSDIEATVTFHAHLLQYGQDASFSEKSFFRKEKGRWLYIPPSDQS